MMKNANNKNECPIYFGNIDELHTLANSTSIAAGENLHLYRMHCHLSLRTVECETNISYSKICIYEKEGVKNIHVYFVLIKFYRDFCKWKHLGEPEGIKEISSLLKN